MRTRSDEYRQYTFVSFEQMLHDPVVSPVSIHRVKPKYMYVLEYITRNLKRDKG